jgi:uncharacterized protein
VPPRDAKAFEVAAGHFFRIVSVEGPQVGDLNLWNAHDLTERFYSGKTPAMERLVSCERPRYPKNHLIRQDTACGIRQISWYNMCWWQQMSRT